MIHSQSLKNTRLIALSISASVVTSCGIVSSDNKVASAPSAQVISKASADKISPITAKPGETVQVSGKDFSEAAGLKASFTLADGSSKDAPLKVASATSASFVMPDGVGLGMKSMKIIQGKDQEVSSFGLVANTASNSLPILIDDQSEICSTKTYIDRNGEQKTGTKNCPQACSEDGASNCVVDGTAYKAAKLANLTPSGVLSGLTVAGVQGLFTTCTENGQQSCVATSTYPAGQFRGSWDMANAFLGAGYYSGATNAPTADSIKSGVTIAGVSGNLVNPDPWDLRAGKTVNSVTGKLKVNCRNRVNSTIYNYDGDIGSISNGEVTGSNINGEVTSGSAIDIWDTIDDYMGAPEVVSGWESNDCGGVETASGDNNVWKDVTTAGSGAASCAGSPEHCTMQDKITGLWWSKLQSTVQTWNTAWSNCQNLNHNGHQTGWRLPTQKELMEAYTHGIRSAARTNWMTGDEMVLWFWSGSSFSKYTSDAWIVDLAYGHPTNSNKSNTHPKVVCVR